MHRKLLRSGAMVYAVSSEFKGGGMSIVSSEELASGLQNMITMYLSDRVLCDQSAIRLLVLEQEIKYLRKQLEESKNESL